MQKEWCERLRAFANGRFTFGKGQMPAKGSKWANEVEKIKRCPLFRSLGTKAITREALKCSCGYHAVS